MFACSVAIYLKPNRVREFTRALEGHVIPVLRRQKGLLDEITMLVPGGLEARAIRLWDQKEDAEAYNRATHPDVLRAPANAVEVNR
jgi:hypothetical protein